MKADSIPKIKLSGYDGLATQAEKSLPFWVSTIGSAPFQPPVRRPLGIEDHQLLYTLWGSGEAMLNGRMTTLTRGTVYYLPPETPHEYHAEGENWKTLYITFGGSGMQGFFGKAFCADISKALDFKKEYEGLYELKADPSNYKKLSAALYGLLTKLSSFAGCGIEPGKSTYSIISHAMRLFSVPEIVYVDDVSKKLGISEAYLCRIFKSYTGYSPVEYMNRLKINRACTLLQQDSFTVSAIAEAVGFESANYFCRIFKRYKKMSPLQYRKSLK